MEHCQKDKRDTKNLVLASIGQGGPIPHAELSPMPWQTEAVTLVVALLPEES
jgi:hypothetical protein